MAAVIRLKSMTIPLDDSRWDNLETAYHCPCDELLAWLSSAYKGALTSELLGDIINEIQHQGDTSTSMYAVAPHLLQLATLTPEPLALELVTHAGLIHASASAPNAVACPATVLHDFSESTQIGLQRSAALLTCPMDSTSLKYLLAAIAGFAGHGRIGRFIEGLDFEDDGVWSSHLDEPIPDLQDGG